LKALPKYQTGNLKVKKGPEGRDRSNLRGEAVEILQKVRKCREYAKRRISLKESISEKDGKLEKRKNYYSDNYKTLE